MGTLLTDSDSLKTFTGNPGLRYGCHAKFKGWNEEAVCVCVCVCACVSVCVGGIDARLIVGAAMCCSPLIGLVECVGKLGDGVVEDWCGRLVPKNEGEQRTEADNGVTWSENLRCFLLLFAVFFFLLVFLSLTHNTSQILSPQETASGS